MTSKVVFRRAARAEFDSAALWYEERQSGLGSQFTSEIDHAVALASAHPDRYPVQHGGFAVRTFAASRTLCTSAQNLIRS